MQVFLPLELDGGDYPPSTTDQVYDSFFEADDRIQFLIFGDVKL